MTATMTEPAKITANAFLPTAKMKALIAVSLFLLGGGLYVLAVPAGPGIVMKDTYTLEIQNRAQLVNNAVLGVVDAQGKEPAYKYQVTCENAMQEIRMQQLKAQQEATTLSPVQRELNQKYRDYLILAGNVVLSSYNGQQKDLTKLNNLKSELN